MGGDSISRRLGGAARMGMFNAPAAILTQHAARRIHAVSGTRPAQATSVGRAINTGSAAVHNSISVGRANAMRDFRGMARIQAPKGFPTIGSMFAKGKKRRDSHGRFA